MGGLAVLHPHDCFRKQHQAPIHPHPKPRRNPNPNPTKSTKSGKKTPEKNHNKNPNPMRSNHRHHRIPEKSDTKSGNNNNHHKMHGNFPAKDLVMGQVKILKRGEKLTDDLALSSANRMGPKPETVPICDFYAGSAVIESPPPSSLPLPAFLR